MAYLYPPGAAALDLVLTGGATAAQAAITAAGFTGGSGGSFDATLGYNGGGTGWREYSGSSAPWAPTMNAATEFTLLLQVRRSDIAKWVGASTNVACDSEGRQPTSDEYPIGFDSGASLYYGVGLNYQSAVAGPGSSLSNVQFNFNASNNLSKAVTMTLSSHYSSYYDDPNGFIEIGWSVTAPTAAAVGSYTLLIDGYPMATETVAAGANWQNAFVRGSFGSNNGSSFFKGWIRRIRIYPKAVKWNYNLFPKIGILGDSFGQRGSNRDNAATDSVADILAVQNDLSNTVLLNSAPNTQRHYNSTASPNDWVFILERWCLRAGLPPFRVYNASKSGTGFYRNPLPANYLTALANWKPEIVIWNFSVNDVDGTGYNPQLQITAAKTMIDSFITQTPTCRRILLCQTFPAKAPLNGWTAANDADMAALTTAQAAAGFDGYSNGIVKFIPAYNLLGGKNYDTRFNLGFYPNIPSGTATNDIHPGGFGMLKMSEVIWPYLYNEISGRSP